MINDEADEVTKAKKPLKNNLESMKHSEFAFYHVHSLYYKCHNLFYDIYNTMNEHNSICI